MRKRSVLLGFVAVLISVGGLVLSVILPQPIRQIGGYMIGIGCIGLTFAILDNIG